MICYKLIMLNFNKKNAMKKWFMILLVLPCLVFGQNDIFDTKCVMVSKRIKPKFLDVYESSTNVFYNSSNSTKYITEYKNHYRLFDFTKKEIFNFTKLIVNGKVVYNTLGIDAMRYDYNEFDINKVTVEKLSENKYLVKTFPKLKSKKTNLEIIFTLKKSNYPLTQIRFLDLSPSIHEKIYTGLLENLDTKNYQWEIAEVNYRNGYEFIEKIENCQQTNLKLVFQ